MKYFYKSMLSSFWVMLTQMVEENYASEYETNDTLIMGLNLYYSSDILRNEYISNKCDKLIIYQLEPLVENHWWSIDKVIASLKGADEIWDYDLDNIEILKTYGINAKFKPIVYTNSLKRIQKNDSPDIDVLFFGTPTTYRSKFIENFISGYEFMNDDFIANTYANLSIVSIVHISDHRLDELISRSKIILNLNPYEGVTRQQQTRIFYPLINDKCVMSQRSNRNYFGNCIIEFDNHQDFGDKVIELIGKDTWRNYPTFTNYPSFSKDRRDYESFLNRKLIT